MARSKAACSAAVIVSGARSAGTWWGYKGVRGHEVKGFYRLLSGARGQGAGPPVQVPEDVLDLAKGGAEVVRDLLSEDVGVGEVLLGADL